MSGDQEYTPTSVNSLVSQRGCILLAISEKL